MKLTEKETLLLKDLKTQEQLCIDKYAKYASEASDKNLKELFKSIGKVEEGHFNTIQKIQNGETVQLKSSSKQAQKTPASKLISTVSGKAKEKDSFLCQDALTTEKQVASAYNTSIFEFAQPKLRNILNHIQKEEQEHGLRLYEYMAQNQMYQAK